MTSVPLRVGVLGLGEIGVLHARNAHRLDDMSLVAVASARPVHAQHIADALGPTVRACTYEQMVADAEIEAVVVASRTNRHVEHARMVLESGKHLLLEKPGAPTLAGARAIRDAADHNPRTVARAAYMRRHDPGFRRLHEIVRSGELGVLIAIHVADRESWPPDEDPAETGGFVLDVGVHDFDTVRWLSGQEVASVYGTAHATAYPQADLDNAYLVLDLSGGAKATVHQSRTSPVGHDIRCEVVGTQASALLMPEGIKPTLTVLSGDTSGSFPNGFADRWSSAYEEELRDFVRACRKLEDASATLDDDLQAVAIGVAARASVVQGSSFEVGPDWSWEAPSPY